MKVDREETEVSELLAGEAGVTGKAVLFEEDVDEWETVDGSIYIIARLRCA